MAVLLKAWRRECKTVRSGSITKMRGTCETPCDKRLALPPLPADGGLSVQGFRRRDDRLRNFHELLVLVAGKFLQPAERFRLVHAKVLHQQTLGPLDQLPVGQRLPQVGGFFSQRLELLVTPHRQAYGGLDL